jgi:hypothetical protein
MYRSATNYWAIEYFKQEISKVHHLQPFKITQWKRLEYKQNKTNVIK